MPKTARKISETGLYHVTLKGVNSLIIFEESQDCRVFIRYMSEVFGECEVKVIAWALMTNHVHIILSDCKMNLSSAMDRLAGKYARYFNSKYDRTGHLYKDRFWSDPILDEAHLLQGVRYVLLNPQRAGMSLACLYAWSSYKEYVGTPFLTDTSLILSMIGGKEHFAEYMASGNGLCPFKKRNERVSDWDAISMVVEHGLTRQPMGK